MKRIWLIASLQFLLMAPPAWTGELAPPQPVATDKCMVCGMFVAKYPDWTATIVFRDGAARFFDGPKDLFTYYFSIKKYEPRRVGSRIDNIWVKDYYSLSFIDAKKAFYVIGSDVFGPMGRELVAFRSADDAWAFLKDHGGRKVLRFTDITPEVMKQLE